MLINLPIGLVNVWVARAQCKSARWQGSGQRGFLVQTKADNGLAKLQKAASSLLYEGSRKDADKEANGCFPQDNGRERKGFQKDQSQGTGSKTAYFWEQIHKTTRLVAF